SNSGTFTANGSAITIGGTSATPSIDGFSTTGGLSFTRTVSRATLNGNVTAASLAVNGSGGTLDLGTGKPHTVNGAVTFTAGTLGNGVTISRDTGTLSAAPTFGTSVNVTYTGTTGVTTGPEIPSTASVLATLTINKSGGVTLNADSTINTSLTLTSGALSIGAH